jgi:hypothetical protein
MNATGAAPAASTAAMSIAPETTAAASVGLALAAAL